MTGLDWENARRRPAPSEAKALGPVVAPVKSGKRYPTEKLARNAARYLNSYGKQRHLWEWFPRRTEDGEAFELWHRPRSEAQAASAG